MNEFIEYYIYVNAFWSGFIDKTDANHIDFFENILKQTKLSNYQITNDLDKANVLFESLFGNSFVNVKQWKYKIHYSGEPHCYDVSNYDLVLFGMNTEKNIVDLPLFAYYIHGNHLLPKLMNQPIISKVPELFCCFIVSNAGCYTRNKMFHLLNKYKKVDSYGNYENNMGFQLPFHYWTQDFIHFLSKYKFIICFENRKVGTYSTEKIVNAYLANIIPIYWSTHHVKNIFNKDSMLFLEDETESSFESLVDKIKELDNDDEKYIEFVNRPILTNINYWNENYTIEKIAKKIDQCLL
jgi:hypothetical protein